jgi:hypothetical protein
MVSDVYAAGQVSPAAVAAIVRLTTDGYSYRQIAAYLDRKGIKPPKAKRWSAMTVRNVSIRSQ